MVDTDGAEKNLEAELPGWGFRSNPHKSAEIWNDALNAIEIQSADPDRNGQLLYGIISYDDRTVRLSGRRRSLSGYGQKGA